MSPIIEALGTFLWLIPSKHWMARVVDLAASGMAASCDPTPRILIADGQPDLLDALKLLLKGQGIECDAVTSPDAAVRALESRPFDLVLMERLLAAAVTHRACSAPALQARLTGAVAAFTGGPLQDDATLMVLAADQG